MYSDGTGCSRLAECAVENLRVRGLGPVDEPIVEMALNCIGFVGYLCRRLKDCLFFLFWWLVSVVVTVDEHDE